MSCRMNLKEKKMKYLIGIIVFLFLLVSPVIGTYNGLQNQDEKVNSAYAQVDNQLKRRNDLIPNLVNVTKGYAKHESKVFTDIADARAKLGGAKTVEETSKANGELSSALSRLLMVAENYPQLKADKQFIQLSDELAGTENRIAVARMDYNNEVKKLNSKLRTFPTNIVGGMFNIEKREYFETAEAEKVTPKVEF